MRQSDDCSSQVGLIGAGRWGGHLVRVLHGLGVLGMVADTDPATRADLRARYPELKLGEDPQAVIGNDALRAVVVATPAPTHYEMAKRALLAGKDVFVEKPLALSSAEAHELTSLAETKRAVLMAGHLLLYQPAIQWVKEYLASGALGELYTLHQERLKLGRVRSVESVLWSFGVHDLAVMLYLLGEAPGQVRATGQRVLQGGIEDNVHLDLRFSRGTRAHLHVSWLWPEQRRRLTIVGAKGMLVHDELEATVTLHRKTVGADLQERDEGSEVLFRATGDALEAECLHFLSCVRTRRPPLSDGRSAVEVIRVIEAAQAAMNQEGVPAPRPLDPRDRATGFDRTLVRRGATCAQCGRRYQASKAGLSPRDDHHVARPRPGKDE